MSFGKYRYSALASIDLSDAITGLLSRQVIMADMAAASELVPFKFYPRTDPAFFTDIYWQVPYDELIENANKVIKRFDRWYKNNTIAVEQVYLAIAALTDSDDQINTIIDDAKNDIIVRHRTELIDCDDAIYYIADYHATRDPFNITNALNTDIVNWWRGHFEAQAHRILTLPKFPFDQFMLWNQARDDRFNLIRDHFRKDGYAKNGITVQQGRRILNRSIRLFSNFFGAEAARNFVNGKPLKIRANYFEWELKAIPNTLINYTIRPPTHHVPYGLYLNDLEGHRLADACVVFDKTPVLDQAVSIGVSVAFPEDELALLQKTNISRMTRAGLDNENLKCLGLPGMDRHQNRPWHPEDEETALERFETRVQRYVTEERELQGYVAGEPERIDPAADWGCTMSRVYEPEFDPADAVVDARLDEMYANSRLPSWYLTDNDASQYLGDALRESLRDQLRTKIRRERDPIASLLRAELYRRLDIRPDLLEYMAAPEINILNLHRLTRAPRLQSFIEHKLPLGL